MAMRESGRKGGLCDRVDSLGSAISAGKFDLSPFSFSVLNFDGFFRSWRFCEFDSFKMNECYLVTTVSEVKDFTVFVTVTVTA